jgi:hypothetical protein
MSDLQGFLGHTLGFDPHVTGIMEPEQWFSTALS